MTTNPVYPVTQQQPWTYALPSGDPWFTDTDALSDPQAYAFSTAATSFQTSMGTTGLQRVSLSPSVESNNLALKFIGSPDSAAAGTSSGTVYQGQAAFWGISQITKASPATTEYLGEFLGSVDLTVGLVDVGASSIFPSTSFTPYLCRKIEPRLDASLFPGFRIVGQEADACPILLLDSLGYDAFVVEMKCREPDGATTTAADRLGFAYRMI